MPGHICKGCKKTHSKLQGMGTHMQERERDLEGEGGVCVCVGGGGGGGGTHIGAS